MPRLLVVLLGLLLSATLHAAEVLADRVLIKKSERKLYLLQGEQIMRSYDIALGLMPEGHKQREGDFRTPEGDYLLTNRLDDSDFFLAIQISYPNNVDEAKAQRLGVSPGGQIMIHGQPGEPKIRRVLRQLRLDERLHSSVECSHGRYLAAHGAKYAHYDCALNTPAAESRRRMLHNFH